MRPVEKAGLLPTKRRTSEQVRADNEEKEHRKAADLAAKAAAKNAKVSRIAELEEQMAVNDADEQLLTRTFAVFDLNGAYEDGRQPKCTGVVVTNAHKKKQKSAIREAVSAGNMDANIVVINGRTKDWEPPLIRHRYYTNKTNTQTLVRGARMCVP
ncbi:hypothetical protein EW026_g7422 [Hermanssonia centrifuga]|uniref:Uncharacterized protein n=1 Tax=Hermanssonia centrifuga TaxID=98765 RepID=A0A4S4KCC0_9APHY|nr:hypothetical protein EW026_g7422 [Hermanssonia centrifuga]